jgi:hypothetical protein
VDLVEFNGWDKDCRACMDCNSILVTLCHSPSLPQCTCNRCPPCHTTHFLCASQWPGQNTALLIDTANICVFIHGLSHDTAQWFWLGALMDCSVFLCYHRALVILMPAHNAAGRAAAILFAILFTRNSEAKGNKTAYIWLLSYALRILVVGSGPTRDQISLTELHSVRVSSFRISNFISNKWIYTLFEKSRNVFLSFSPPILCVVPYFFCCFNFC